MTSHSNTNIHRLQYHIIPRTLQLQKMSEKQVEAIKKNLQAELDTFKACCKEHEKAITKRHQLDAQLNENTFVKNELDLLKEDGEVYKLIGPVLLKQDLEEAKQNVGKRMEYILGELKQLDELIPEIDTKLNKHRENLATLQKNLKDASMELAQKKCHPNQTR